MSNSGSDDSSMDDESEAAIVIVNSEDETVDSEAESDQSIPSRYVEDSANSPVALAAREEILSREDERTLEHPDLGIIDDVAAIVDVVSDGYSHQIQSLRTEAATSSAANSSMSDFRPAKRIKLSSASEDSDEEAEVCCSFILFSKISPLRFKLISLNRIQKTRNFCTYGKFVNINIVDL